MSKSVPKPTPVVVTTICSLCDEPWEAHGDDPTTSDCIRLLKAKIASLPAATPVYIYPNDWRWQPNTIRPIYYQPQWSYTAQGISATSIDAFGRSLGAATTVSGTTNNVIEFRTPRDDEDDGDAPVPVRV